MRIILLLFVLASFQLSGQQPSIYKINNTDISTEDNFGTSVAVSEEYIAVGSIGTENMTGSITIYKGAGPDWNLVSTHLHSDGQEGDFMGMDIAMSESHIIVGAPTDHWVDNQTGRAFIYALDDDSWKEQVILQPTPDFDQSAFGFIVNIHEDFAIVGAPDYGGVGGAAVLYKREGNDWNEHHTFKAPSYDYNSFGGSIDVSDEWVAIGAYEQNWNNIEDGTRLVVFLYQWDGVNWIEKQKIDFEYQQLPYQIPWYGVEFGNDQLLISNHRTTASVNIDGGSKVFNLEEDKWVESQTIQPEGFGLHEAGRHAAHSDKFAIIGASIQPTASSNEPHHLLVYNKADKNNWQLIGDYAFEGSSLTNWQGFNLDINDHYAVASSHHHANEHGDVHVIDLRRFVNNENLLAENEISIFPIPTNSEINIQSKEAHINQYLIFNHLGQVVKNEQGLQEHQINLGIHDLPEGNYWIKVVTEEGYLYRQISKIK